MEMIILIAVNLVLLLAAYALGQWVAFNHVAKIITDSMAAEPQERTSEQLTLTQEQGQWYAWGDGDRFLAQHTELSALLRDLRVRYPQQRFYLLTKDYSQELMQEIEQAWNQILIDTTA